MATIRTIGYQGYGPDAWLHRLLDEGIELLVDVRELPRSRRPGFSRRALAERLEAAGIAYLGVRELGAPPALRIPLREGSLPFAEFAPAFRELLAGREAELAEVLRLAGRRRTCLMCFEEDPRVCHRILVAEALRALSARGEQAERLRIVHLRRDGSSEEG